MDIIPLAEPNLSGKEQEYVTDAIASGWVSGGGPYVERFEEMVAKACGRRWCVAVLTGTSALHAGMRALGISHGVYVPKRTFVAVYNVIEEMGGKAYPRDGAVNHDCARIEMMGRDWPALVDAAPAVGAIRPEDGTLHCLSFNGNKTITTGQGGAILGDDAGLEKKIRKLIVPKEGGKFNYRMANINAAMGCAQMERLDEFLEKKRVIWSRYKDAGLNLIEAGESRWMSVVDITPQGRILADTDDGPLRTYDHHAMTPESLATQGIDARPLWGMYDYICLPCSTTLTEEQQDKVIRAIHSLG